MGFHICEFCGKDSSSGDVTLKFTSGRSYIMPDMILHYIQVHNYSPPRDFVNDVMNSAFIGAERVQTRSISAPLKVGYLSGSIPTGDIPLGFLSRLKQLMQQAEQEGNRQQTKSL